MRKRYFTRLSKLLIASVLLAGCVAHPFEDTLEGGDDVGTVRPDGTLTLSLLVPGARTNTVSTYADIMDEWEECQISTIDVLVFNADNSSSSGIPLNAFLYHEQGVNIQDGADATIRNFDMKIRQTTDPSSVYLMILANVSDVVETAIANGDIVAESTTSDEVMRMLLFDLPVDETSEQLGGKWLVKPGRYTLFPMWGLSETIDLTQSVISVDPVTLLRAVAKVDIGLDFQTDANGDEVAQGLSNFYLEEFHLYNALNQLYIAPDPLNYDATGKLVTAPSIPSTADTFDPNIAISYYRRDYRGTAGYNDFLNEIYLAEHPAGSQDDRLNNACVVIGGRYGSTSAAITYYRIDFVKITKAADGTVTNTEFLPVLRNHRYRINITAVKDRGYDTKEEAFAAMGINTNLEVELENSNENITSYKYDGQYYLGVSTNALTIDKNGVSLAYAREIDIDTNYDYSPAWKATANASWITFVQADGTSTGTSMTGSTGETVLKFVVAANTGSANRTGQITIQAGRLFQYIDVEQTTSASVEVISKDATYPMNGVEWTFTMTTTYPWKARIANDPYNVIRSFTKEGVRNTTGLTFSLTFINEMLMNALPADQKTQKVTLEIYSANDPAEFDPYPIEVTGTTNPAYYDWGLSYYVYKTDQAANYSWYVYANVPDGTNNTTVPGPGVTGQVVPARANSCAALGDKWRLPTSAELTAIYNYANGNGGVSAFGFSSTYYWSATSSSTTNATFVNFYSGNTYNNAKTFTGYRARCIRDK
ncbi:MAG: DUF1566 domain-containing protein [Bacteroides sp.]|nr:DUF1566 domain-containing protein [Bacteroides sp.]